MDGVERNVRDVQDCTMYRARLWFGAKLSAGSPARVQELGKEAQNNQAERQDDSQHSVISSETGLDNYNVDPNGTAWHTPGPAYMFWAYIFGRFSLPSLDLCQPLHFATPHSETEIDRLAGVQNDSPHYMHYSSPCTCIKKKTRVNISAARVARLVLGP